MSKKPFFPCLHPLVFFLPLQQMSENAKDFVCDHPGCQKAYDHRRSLERHKLSHLEYEDREFGCQYNGCSFRSNRKAGLQLHISSIHWKIRLPCNVPGCTKTFSDPSGLARHRQKVHHIRAEVRWYWQGYGYQGHRSESHQRPNVTESTFSSDDPSNTPLSEMRPPASHGPSSAPSSSGYRSNHPAQSPPRSGFHPATDVRTDCWSIDKNNQIQHQAYNANPEAAPRSGYERVPSPLHPEGPSFPHPFQPVMEPRTINSTQDGLNEPCHSVECDFRSLTLTRGYHQQEEIIQRREDSRTRSHVPPPSDRILPPTTIANYPSSSAYLRPNLGMLFG